MANEHYKNKDNGNVVKVIEGEAHGKVKVKKCTVIKMRFYGQ